MGKTIDDNGSGSAELKKSTQKGRGKKKLLSNFFQPASDSENYSQYGYGYGYGYGQNYSNREKSLRDYPLILYRYWPLIVCLIVVGVSIAAYKTKNTPKLYRSNSMVNIGSYVAPIEGPTGETLEEETRRANYVNTQSTLLKSFSLADQVLKQHPDILRFLSPDKTIAIEQATKSSASLPVSILQSYINRVSFDAIKGTTMVRIYATTTNSDMSARIANAHASSFIELVEERRKKSANINIRFLKERLQDAEDKLESAEKERLQFARAHSLIASGSEVSEQTFNNRFESIVSGLGRTLDQKIERNSYYSNLRSTGGLGLSYGDNFIVNNRMKLARLEQDYNEVIESTKDSFHPALKRIRRQIEFTKRALRNYGRERVRDARREYSRSASKERYLREEFEKLRSEELEASQHKIKYEILSQEVEAAQQVHASLSKRYEDATINAQNRQETVSIVDQAFATTGHISPNKSSNLWTGALLGLLFGVVLAIMLDILDNTVKSVRDLQDALQLPVLGVVPQYSRELLATSRSFFKNRQINPPEITDSELAGLDTSSQQNEEASVLLQQLGDSLEMSLAESNPVPMFSAPFSDESEAFRGILAAVTADDETEHQRRRLLVTSGQKGDGKTTLSLNLSLALAQMGERTLLIDADLRVPTIHKYFDQSRHVPGLVDCLTEEKQAEEVILNGGSPNFHVLLSGAPAVNPAALLRSNKMATLLQSLEEQFDYVIIDSPPIGPVADTLLLCRHVHGVAIVVRAGQTPQPVVETAIARIRQVGGEILGLVLNNANRKESFWKASVGNSARGYQQPPQL